MAYVDSNARHPSPASITGAVAINALIISGIILAAPDLVPEKPWKILQTYGVVPPPPPEPARASDKPVKSAEAKHFTPPKPDAATPEPSEGLIPQPGAGLFPPGTGGGGIIAEPSQPLPQPRIPVLTGAKIHPRYAGALQPDYPPGMIREGREGLVIVRVLIGTDGRVRAVEPVSSDGDAFLAVTRKQALGKWRFLPATRDGEPVEAWREMTVRFRLPAS